MESGEGDGICGRNPGRLEKRLTKSLFGFSSLDLSAFAVLCTCTTVTLSSSNGPDLHIKEENMVIYMLWNFIPVCFSYKVKIMYQAMITKDICQKMGRSNDNWDSEIKRIPFLYSVSSAMQPTFLLPLVILFDSVALLDINHR